MGKVNEPQGTMKKGHCIYRLIPVPAVARFFYKLDLNGLTAITTQACNSGTPLCTPTALGTQAHLLPAIICIHLSTGSTCSGHVLSTPPTQGSQPATLEPTYLRNDSHSSPWLTLMRPHIIADVTCTHHTAWGELRLDKTLQHAWQNRHCM